MNSPLEQFDGIDDQADELQFERIKALLSRLPVCEDKLGLIDHGANSICGYAKITRELGSALYGNQSRKPVAGVTTAAAAAVFLILTGRCVTRVSKVKKGELGQKEVGPFADFLGEVFEILEIDARPAGQVKQLKTHLREEFALHLDDADARRRQGLLAIFGLTWSGLDALQGRLIVPTRWRYAHSHDWLI